MKRFLAALSLSAVAFSASALEVGKPFEQLDIDRALPNIAFAAVPAYVATSRAPYEQLNIDRALPNIAFAAVPAYVMTSHAPAEQLNIDRTLPTL